MYISRGSAQCKSGFCECADGYYNRTENICRIESTIGEPCVVHTDCIDENNVCTEVKTENGIEFFCLLPTSRRVDFVDYNQTRADSTKTANVNENEGDEKCE